MSFAFLLLTHADFRDPSSPNEAIRKVLYHTFYHTKPVQDGLPWTSMEKALFGDGFHGWYTDKDVTVYGRTPDAEERLKLNLSDT